jgi:hypothetical protein
MMMAHRVAPLLWLLLAAIQGAHWAQAAPHPSGTSGGTVFAQASGTATGTAASSAPRHQAATGVAKSPAGAAKSTPAAAAAKLG